MIDGRKDSFLPYPWQARQWQFLWHAKQTKRLSHALLLIGMPGIGKAQFATAWVHALLCKHPNIQGHCCQACRPCHMVAARSHPDTLWIEPEKVGQAIKVDQIRVANEFAHQTALQNGKRIIVIDSAANMNDYSANALLKTLEEPPPGVLFMLITDRIRCLPATIISRCQRVTFAKPPYEQIVAWLQAQLLDKAVDVRWLLDVANGAPLVAQRLTQDNTLILRQDLFQALYALGSKQSDPLVYAVRWQTVDTVCLVELIQSWVLDVLRLQLDGNVVNKDYAKQLKELCQQLFIKQIISFLDYLQQLQRDISKGVNLNKQLLLEAVFIRWRECFSFSVLSS
jgi:DNA polymerase-3 subunit delta'